VRFAQLSTQTEWNWFVERTHVLAVEDSTGIVAYEDDGRLAAVMVADSFSPDGCNAHWAIENPMVIKHGFINEVARHLFITRGRKRIFGLIPANNANSLRFSKHIGMNEVARIPHAMGEGIDYIVMVMLREDTRWLTDEMREAA
jgi:hypothetical protein